MALAVIHKNKKKLLISDLVGIEETTTIVISSFLWMLFLLLPLILVFYFALCFFVLHMILNACYARQ